jgi:hypothetical protein
MMDTRYRNHASRVLAKRASDAAKAAGKQATVTSRQKGGGTADGDTVEDDAPAETPALAGATPRVGAKPAAGKRPANRSRSGGGGKRRH